MNNPITTADVNLRLRNQSQGSLTIKDIYLTAQGILHLTLEDAEKHTIEVELDPITRPTIK